MVQRTLTGAVILPNGTTLANGTLHAQPLQPLPTDPADGLLLPVPTEYAITDGTLNGTIIGPCYYVFTLPEAGLTFRASVSDEDAPITFQGIYGGRFTPVAIPATVGDMIASALAAHLAAADPHGQYLLPEEAGAGDMTRAVYDTNDDGRVDAADHATAADSATTATNAGHATTADSATAATNATNAANVSTLTTTGDLPVRGTTTTERLPVGTDGQVLTADSGSATGVAWGDIAAGGSPALHPGRVPDRIYPGLSGTGATNTTYATGTLYMAPCWIPADDTYNRMGIRVGGTGVAGSSVRLGLYTSVDGQAAALVIDAGTVATTSGGVKEVAISQFIPAGMYWLAVTLSTSVQLLGISAGLNYVENGFSEASLPNMSTGSDRTLTYTHAYGALPGTLSGGAYASMTPVAAWIRRV